MNINYNKEDKENIINFLLKEVRLRKYFNDFKNMDKGHSAHVLHILNEELVDMKNDLYLCKSYSQRIMNYHNYTQYKTVKHEFVNMHWREIADELASEKPNYRSVEIIKCLSIETLLKYPEFIKHNKPTIRKYVLRELFENIDDIEIINSMYYMETEKNRFNMGLYTSIQEKHYEIFLKEKNIEILCDLYIFNDLKDIKLKVYIEDEISKRIKEISNDDTNGKSQRAVIINHIAKKSLDKRIIAKVKLYM